MVAPDVMTSSTTTTRSDRPGPRPRRSRNTSADDHRSIRERPVWWPADVRSSSATHGHPEGAADRPRQQLGPGRTPAPGIAPCWSAPMSAPPAPRRRRGNHGARQPATGRRRSPRYFSRLTSGRAPPSARRRGTRRTSSPGGGGMGSGPAQPGDAAAHEARRASPHTCRSRRGTTWPQCRPRVWLALGRRWDPGPCAHLCAGPSLHRQEGHGGSRGRSRCCRPGW